eukprot:1680813-Pyramimonas_sp.AAC.1
MEWVTSVKGAFTHELPAATLGLGILLCAAPGVLDRGDAVSLSFQVAISITQGLRSGTRFA